jgi:5-methylcytosine-specific restriction endonuclease McrA
MTPHLKPKRERLKRNSVAWKNRVKEVFLRDRYQCQICKNTFLLNFLCPHHIKSIGAGGGDDLENLITLCKKCHIDLHNGNVKL